MWMAGYAARAQPAVGKQTELWAKACVLEDPAGSQACIVTLDLLGIDRSLSQSVCRDLREQYGLGRQQIAICCSHTHSGPVVGRNAEPLHYMQVPPHEQQKIDQYADFLRRAITDVVGQAISRLSPAKLSWGSGQATFAVNRRNNRQESAAELRERGRLVGPVDYDVPVLAIRDHNDQLKAVLFGYACHATVLDAYHWSGDYPGYAQQELESSRPGLTAMFWAGCGADQNPLPRRRLELAEEYGRQLAEAVTVVLNGIMQPVEGSLHTRYREVSLPLATLPTEQQLLDDTRSRDRYVAARAQRLIARIESGQPLEATYPYPIGVWDLGDVVQFITLGGEVVVDYALRLKQESGGVTTWVSGYAHDVMAYIPSRRVLREGGYEGGGAMVYYGLPTVWDERVEQIILEMVHDLRRRSPVPR
jgi:hypothetical protein